MLDVVIIGGGVVGTTIARELSRYKLNIALLEQQPDVAMGATKANSAIVHGGYAEAHYKLKGRLCYQGRKQFKQLNDELQFGFKEIGSMVLAFTQEEKLDLEKMLENGLQNGLPDLELLDRETILEREPTVNPEVLAALYCKGAGVCSPFEMAIAMMENAITNGAQLFLNSTVIGIEKKEDYFVIHTKEGECFTARLILNAAGLQAGEIAAMAGVEGVEIHPRTGEYVVLAKSYKPLAGCVLFQMPTKMGKGILFTPTVYGNYMIGPDAIDEQLNDRSTHLPRLYSIYKEALKTCPELPVSSFIRSYAGVRAVSSTDDFIIEESSVKGFINVAGIQSPGLTSSPAIAQMVVEILKQTGLALEEKKDFTPTRKPTYQPHALLDGASMKELLELPFGAPGRMVCRCEQVSEKTIVDAMNRGMPLHTVDGIKRRTRAGMGPCQGGFCLERVVQLCQQLGHPLEDNLQDYERESVTRVNRAQFLEYMQQKEP